MMSITKVTDSRSNAEEQIVHAAQVIGKAKQRAAVFEAICCGKQKIKTVGEISESTRLPRKRVLEEGKRLVSNHVVTQVRKDGDTAYEKDEFFSANKKRILSLAGNKKKIANVPTKRNPRAKGVQVVAMKLPSRMVRVRQITIDDISAFSKACELRRSQSRLQPIVEKTFKRGVQKLLGEQGTFNDWGGERSDLFTTQARVCGRRRAIAFAFKGKGKRGKLVPAKMGKNGDQIQRLFTSPAEVFVVQYWGQIDESVVEQMEAFATAKSVKEEKEILFGVIDGQDTSKILRAYSNAF